MGKIIHINFVCHELSCDFYPEARFPEIRKFREQAIAHSKKTGHYVVVETGTHDVYENGVKR